ncbi:hypothetical protein NDU88_002371 [Pleurodeles waltl]|uniref:Secreted protein n=1 Tax=Pleurodeles waltl TaxID=8319 RepID=A0AAV7W342_PLEWA|nr:hypothetical protein NDU88_002371 [Pleurodeles waltl]
MLSSLRVFLPDTLAILAIGGLRQSHRSVELMLQCRCLLLHSQSGRLRKSLFLLFLLCYTPSVRVSPVIHLGASRSSLVFQMILSDVPMVNRGRLLVVSCDEQEISSSPSPDLIGIQTGVGRQRPLVPRMPRPSHLLVFPALSDCVAGHVRYVFPLPPGGLSLFFVRSFFVLSLCWS